MEGQNRRNLEQGVGQNARSLGQGNATKRTGKSKIKRSLEWDIELNRKSPEQGEVKRKGEAQDGELKREKEEPRAPNGRGAWNTKWKRSLE